MGRMPERSGSLGGAVSYMSDLLVSFGVPASSKIWLVALAIVIGGLATFFTIRGIRISARVSLVLELASVAIILILLILLIVLGIMVVRVVILVLFVFFGVEVRIRMRISRDARRRA